MSELTQLGSEDAPDSLEKPETERKPRSGRHLSRRRSSNLPSMTRSPSRVSNSSSLASSLGHGTKLPTKYSPLDPIKSAGGQGHRHKEHRRIGRRRRSRSSSWGEANTWPDFDSFYFDIECDFLRIFLCKIKKETRKIVPRPDYQGCRGSSIWRSGRYVRRVTGHSSASWPLIGQPARVLSSDWLPVPLVPHMIPAACLILTTACGSLPCLVESVCLMSATREHRQLMA